MKIGLVLEGGANRGVFTSGGYVVQHSDLDVSYSRSQRPQQMEAAQ